MILSFFSNAKYDHLCLPLPIFRLIFSWMRFEVFMVICREFEHRGLERSLPPIACDLWFMLLLFAIIYYYSIPSVNRLSPWIVINSQLE